MSTGAVIENLSNRKLFALIAFLAAVQLAFFVLGGVISPEPSSPMEFTMSLCEDGARSKGDRWFYIRPAKTGCKRIASPMDTQLTDGRQLVYVAQMPHPRDNIQLEYSPWFSTLLGVLTVDVAYDKQFTKTPDTEPLFSLEVRLGAKTGDVSQPWTEFASTTISRQLRCEPAEFQQRQPETLHCDPLELFELGSVDYPFYLLNIRVPSCDNATQANCQLPMIANMKVIVIHQNGGFTAVWLGMKTLLTPVMICAVFWYWRRVQMMVRHPHLLEKAIFALGLATVALDLPIEWISLLVRTPFMLLLSDIRQGVFYAMLFSFWLIFAGEHLLDDAAPKNKLTNYRGYLTCVAVSCACMFLFDLCERGVHLANPFHSIWATAASTQLAYAFIIVACVSAALYFGLLAYKVCQVIGTIQRKRHSLHQMVEQRKLKFEGIIYRFRFLMLFTLVCAGMTVAGFIMQQVGEGDGQHFYEYDDDEDETSGSSWLGGQPINATSAFLTSVYGLWNIYVLLLLSMYAPSHKIYKQAQRVPTNDDSSEDFGGEDEDNIMLDEMPTTAAEEAATQPSALVQLIDNKRQD